MKPSLMSRLEQPNFAVSIRAACLSLGAQDVTARLWNMSTKSPSPPVGRFVQCGDDPQHQREPTQSQDSVARLFPSMDERQTARNCARLQARRRDADEHWRYDVSR